MTIPSAILYTPYGEIAIIVHIDGEDEAAAEEKLANDPAFNPDGLIQTRMDRDVYDQCSSHYDIMVQTVAILTGDEDQQAMQSQQRPGGFTQQQADASPMQSLAQAIQANIDAIDAAVDLPPPQPNANVTGNIT